MRWSAVLEGEDVAAGVIVATKELTLPIVEVAPGAWRGDREAVDGDRLVGVAACLSQACPTVRPG